MYFSGEKICLITGANSGIGKAAAKGLAKLGATIILVSRNHTRGERTAAELEQTTGSNKFHLFMADLSSQSSILRLANEIKDKFNNLDILINNAGAYFSKRHITIDGVEATFSVNYLSRFLLTNLLMEMILKSKQGRIINVSGEYHRKGRINFEDMEYSKNYSAFKAICRARLADILFVYELSRRLKNTKVTANSLHPGLVATNIIDNDPDSSLIKRILYKSISPFLKTPEEGAETVIYLASSPEVANVTGRYFINKKSVQSSQLSYDEKLAAQLWKTSEQMINADITKNTFY
jgi:NAD(P)-dependent dehydrogenase (short-subunit alcohol dehydrogenase family)